MKIPNRVIKVGIAGQGRSGWGIHAAWLRKEPSRYRVVAVADGNEEYRAQAARELGCRAYEGPEGLLADPEVELFINATPSHLHVDWTLRALAAGRHVVCEKPVAFCASDIERMMAAAGKAGRLFAPFQNSRFAPHFQKMQEVIASGVLGRIVHIRFVLGAFQRRWDWQTVRAKGGGSLNNTGPHPLDQAIALFGEAMPEVFCRMDSCNVAGDADDFCALTLSGKGAPVIEINLSSVQAFPQEPYTVCGTNGSLAGTTVALRWKWFDPSEAPLPPLQEGWAPDRGFCKEQLPWREETWSYNKELSGDIMEGTVRDFYANLYAALTDGTPLIVQPEQVRRQVAVLEECHRQNPNPKGGR
jgi:predicted dehydrogenase